MDKNIKKLTAYFKQFVTPERIGKIEQLVKLRTSKISVALEDVYQDHNIGAILRSCDAFGVQNIHCITGRNNVAVKNAIASGATKWLTVSDYRTTSECIAELKSKNYKIVATSPHATMELSELPVDQKLVFFFGTEKEGLKQETLEKADYQIKIPMFGFTESFNVSVSVALCLYDITTRLRNSKTAWQLTQQQQEQLILDWLKASVDRPDLLEGKFYQFKLY